MIYIYSIMIENKQISKPVCRDFVPKRLAIQYEPPIIIIQYLVLETGKLYHHKMKLDSILRDQTLSREDILHYLKNKHYLYFMKGHLSDELMYKFIDKILKRRGRIGSCVRVGSQKNTTLGMDRSGRSQENGFFSYLQEYEEEWDLSLEESGSDNI